jgi:hypothetical protein
MIIGFAETWWSHHVFMALPLAALGVLGAWRLWQAKSLVSRTLLLYASGVVVAYPLLGVGYYPWYLVPTSAALLFGAGIGAIWSARTIASRMRKATTKIAAGLTAVLLLITVGFRTVQVASAYNWPSYLATYKQAADWIREVSQPGDTVALYEVGVVGFYSGLPVADLLGLVTPEPSKDVGRHQIGDHLRRHPTTFVVDHTRRSVGGFTSTSWFKDRYLAAKQFKDPSGGKVVVYKFAKVFQPHPVILLPSK